MSSGWKQAPSEWDKEEIGEVRGCVCFFFFKWGGGGHYHQKATRTQTAVCTRVHVFHKGDRTSALVQTGKQLVIRKDFNSFYK